MSIVSEITALGACQLSYAIHARQVSCVEVMRAYLDQIARCNPAVNALVCLCDEDALLRAAQERDAQLARGESLGWMHGFPHAIKDLSDAAGIRTTRGSPLLCDFVATADALVAERIRKAGAILIGKTNVPEFGLGSQTYNPVFGATRNPYALSKTAGGSSGGAAAALALRMLPVADGSDMMGSLRNPAAYNNVIGLRPSLGRVPSAPSADVFYRQLGTEGPMGRSVADVAMLLSVQAGFDARAPLSNGADVSGFREPLVADHRPVVLGWLGDFDGYLPMEAGIIDLCDQALTQLQGNACEIARVKPAFSMERVWNCWKTLRHWNVSAHLEEFYVQTERRAQLKPEAVWEIESGLRLSAQDIARAAAERTQWYAALRRLFDQADFLVLPSAQVFPFDVDVHWPQEVAGRAMDTYHRWMEVVIGASLAGLPVISMPIGFNDAGLPMGLQIIGPPQSDLRLLQFAARFEEATGWVERRPPPNPAR